MGWSTYQYISGVTNVLVEQGDDATATVTTWDTAGNVSSTRPYTAAETEAAAADAAFAATTAAVEASRAGLISMAGEQSALTTQMQDDLASVQSGWDTLTAAERTAIMGRVVAAFGTVMDAIAAHLVVSKIIPPPS